MISSFFLAAANIRGLPKRTYNKGVPRQKENNKCKGKSEGKGEGKG